MTLSPQDQKNLAIVIFVTGMAGFLSGMLFCLVGVINPRVLFIGEIIPIGFMVMGIGIKQFGD